MLFPIHIFLSASEYKTTWRLEAGDFTLYEVGSVNGKGLGTLNRGIFDSDTDIAIANPKALAATLKAHTGQELHLSGLNTCQRNHLLAALTMSGHLKAGYKATSP